MSVGQKHVRCGQVDLTVAGNEGDERRDGKKWVCREWKSSSKMETEVEVLVTGVSGDERSCVRSRLYRLPSRLGPDILPAQFSSSSSSSTALAPSPSMIGLGGNALVSISLIGFILVPWPEFWNEPW